MLKIPIIDPERPKLSKNLYKCVFVLFSLGIISIFVIDNNTVHATLVIAGLVVGVIRLIFGTFTVKGTLVLTENAFITVIKEETKTYYLHELKDIKLYCYGYEGEAAGKIPGNGIGNYLRFTNGTEKVAFELQLRAPYIKFLNVLFVLWARQGISFEVYNNYGRITQVP